MAKTIVFILTTVLGGSVAAVARAQETQDVDPKSPSSSQEKAKETTRPKASHTSSKETSWPSSLNLLSPPSLTSPWYISPAELGSMSSMQRIEMNGQLRPGNLTGQEGPSAYQLKTADYSLSAAALAPLSGGAWTAAVEIGRRWHQEVYQFSSFAETTGYLSTTLDLAVAWQMNNSFALGASYDYFVDTYHTGAYGDVAVGLGVYGVAGRWSALNRSVSVDLGVKSGAHAVKSRDNSTAFEEFYKYTAPFVFGKLGYRLFPAVGLGALVKFYDYERKNDPGNIFYNDALATPDQWAVTLMAAYQPVQAIAGRVYYEHLPSAANDHLQGSPAGIVSTDGVSVELACYATRSLSIGASAGYGEGSRNFSSTADPNSSATQVYDYGEIWFTFAL